MNKALCVGVMLLIASSSAAQSRMDLHGINYDAAIMCPGGEVKFQIQFQCPTANTLKALVLNGVEAIEVPITTLEGDELLLSFDYYDSFISAQFAEGRQRLVGHWSKRASNDKSALMEFTARRVGDPVRFTSDSGGVPYWNVFDNRSIVGKWSAQFADDADPAVAVFAAAGGLQGTFLTTTGDYRYLAGKADALGLTLSCFDGSHAFLFKAALQPDGTLKGDFWSGPTYHDTWTAVKDDNAALPDPFGLTKFTGTAAELDALAFPDTTGTTKKLADFPGQARIIELFGTWCPNCLDATRVLTDLDKKFRDKGLSIVGLAFEVTGDAERDRKQVALYAERHNVTYPLLIAGKKDKAEASAKFPVIDKLRAYPTFIFIDAKGEIRGVYTGFSGPATGEEHERLKRALEEKVLDMLED